MKLEDLNTLVICLHNFVDEHTSSLTDSEQFFARHVAEAADRELNRLRRKTGYIATVQLLIPVETQAGACDYLSELFRELPNWQYAPTASGQWSRPQRVQYDQMDDPPELDYDFTPRARRRNNAS